MSDSPLANVELRLVDSIDAAWELKRWLGERRETDGIGYDTETTGFDPFNGRLRLCQFGDLQRGWAVPWELWGGVAAEVLATYEGRFKLHNSPFDVKWSQVHVPGFKPRWDRYDDTMTQAHLHDTTSPRGLKELGDRLVDPRASAGQAALHDQMKANGWTWETVPADLPAYWAYGALDPVITAHVDDQLGAEARGEFAQAYDLEMGANRLCTNMMLHGLKVDVPYVEDAIKRMREWAASAREWLSQYHGVTSPASGGQLGRAWEAMGVPILFWTDNGAPKFTKETLEFYGTQFPQVSALAKTIRAVRQVEKSIGTYLENYLEMCSSDGRVHPSLWVTAAKTSRMSCSDPNLQNATRDVPQIRGSFIAEEGYVLASIDADQIEARQLAHFSEDAGLIEAFRIADSGGPDFFSVVATELFGETIMKKDPRRQRVKNMIYARNYGAGVEKMAVTAGVPVDVMRPMFDALTQRYPGINRYMEMTVAEGRASLVRGMPSVRTPTGRRLTCRPGQEYVLANYKIQGHAAEILKQAGLRLDAAGFGEYMCIPVHDEFILEFPRREAPQLLREAEEILTDRTTYAVPITWSGDLMEERWVKT